MPGALSICEEQDILGKYKLITLLYFVRLGRISQLLIIWLPHYNYQIDKPTNNIYKYRQSNMQRDLHL